jgi:hypothetical protein
MSEDVTGSHGCTPSDDRADVHCASCGYSCNRGRISRKLRKFTCSKVPRCWNSWCSCAATCKSLRLWTFLAVNRSRAIASLFTWAAVRLILCMKVHVRRAMTLLHHEHLFRVPWARLLNQITAGLFPSGVQLPFRKILAKHEPGR